MTFYGIDYDRVNSKFTTVDFKWEVMFMKLSARLTTHLHWRAPSPGVYSWGEGITGALRPHLPHLISAACRQDHC